MKRFPSKDLELKLLGGIENEPDRESRLMSGNGRGVSVNAGSEETSRPLNWGNHENISDNWLDFICIGFRCDSIVPRRISGRSKGKRSA